MIRALVGIGALQFVSMLLLMMRTKILAVTVGVQGVGTIANIDALAALIAQTLSLSLPFAALRFLPAALRDSPLETDLLYRRMRLVLMALLLPATVVCLVLAVVVPRVFGEALVPFQRTMLLGLAGLPVIGLMPFLTNAYAGAVGHMQSMRLTVAHAGVMVVAAVGAGAGLGVDGFYAIYAVLGALLVLVAASRLTTPGIRREDRHPLHLRKALRLPRAIWRFGVWLLPLSFLAPYAGWFVKYDTLKLYGVDAAGILQGAIGISLSVRALLGAAHPVFLTPNVNRQEDPRSRMQWADEFQRATGMLFALALPPLLLFSDVALRILYAPSFLSGSAFVALFVAAEVLTMLSGTYQALIIAGDSMAFHVAQNLTAQLLLAGTAFVALPRIGLAGAGLASLAAPVFLFASTLLFLRRRHGLLPSGAAVRAALLAMAILAVAGAVGSAYPGFSIGVLSAKAALCAAIWLVSLVVLPAEDRVRLRRGVAIVADRGAAMRAAARDRVA